MWSWWRRKRKPEASGTVEQRIRNKYHSFRELLDLNTDCLELMATLQEDLQHVPARRDIVGDRVALIYERAAAIVDALGRLTGGRYPTLTAAIEAQRSEVERYLAEQQELVAPRLAASLSEVGAGHVQEVGGKAADLGEIKNKVGAPVPDGFVMTTEAYRQFCGIPLWRDIRDVLRNLDPGETEALESASRRLRDLVMALPVPRGVEVALTERAHLLARHGEGLAVRSSAVGEGGARTYAGQYMSLLNVPVEQVVEAYKRVVAARFSERALYYRLTTGLLEVDSPLAVLVLPVLRARAAGVMYTRDPADPKSKELWITSTHGLASEIASGRMSADLFVVSRQSPHPVVDRNLARKDQAVVLEPGGGLKRAAADSSQAEAPSLSPAEIAKLAAWGIRIEEYYNAPQDVEWVLDEDGRIWIVQTRTLALVEARALGKAKVQGDPVVSGGRTIFPGRVSGPAFPVREGQPLAGIPEGSVVFLRRVGPDIVQTFSRIAGLVAEWGNVAGHAAALLREFKIPSVFLMKGAVDCVQAGELVSLDAVNASVYKGAFFERRVPSREAEERRDGGEDPIRRRLLQLNLIDPSTSDFRPSGCKSTHDVIRFCHEKAVETMFDVNDLQLERTAGCAKKLDTNLPVDLYVLDLGGGLAMANPAEPKVSAAEVVCRPFQALWRGATHPGVTWTREMPASLRDLASVMASSLAPKPYPTRLLGEKSYLLVSDEYMNLNARLAFHFTLIDACVSPQGSRNYISFRFVGGGTTRRRIRLRACFIEQCLTHYGFTVDRRGDLVNAWYKKRSAEDTEANLDILGRLMACSGQLDMYMTSPQIMKWYVAQFLAGNYLFLPPAAMEQ